MWIVQTLGEGNRRELLKACRTGCSQRPHEGTVVGLGVGLSQCYLPILRLSSLRDLLGAKEVSPAPSTQLSAWCIDKQSPRRRWALGHNPSFPTGPSPSFPDHDRNWHVCGLQASGTRSHAFSLLIRGR